METMQCLVVMVMIKLTASVKEPLFTKGHSQLEDINSFQGFGFEPTVHLFQKN